MWRLILLLLHALRVSGPEYQTAHAGPLTRPPRRTGLSAYLKLQRNSLESRTGNWHDIRTRDQRIKCDLIMPLDHDHQNKCERPAVRFDLESRSKLHDTFILVNSRTCCQLLEFQP